VSNSQKILAHINSDETLSIGWFT